MLSALARFFICAPRFASRAEAAVVALAVAPALGLVAGDSIAAGRPPFWPGAVTMSRELDGIKPRAVSPRLFEKKSACPCAPGAGDCWGAGRPRGFCVVVAGSPPFWP